MSVVLKSTGGGQVTLQEPTTAADYIQTLPASTGTVMVSGNMPAFSAYRSGTQNITTATWTKVQLNSEDFDTASCFDSTTNYRFTPTVAGYYQINGAVHLSNTTDPILQTRVAIYKNGTSYRYANVNLVYPTYNIINDTTLQVSALIYMNGSSDYLELYCYEYAGGTPQIVDTISTCLNGTLVRTS